MFKKEAKEYAKSFEKEYHTAYGALLDAFQDGAEFGFYNRAVANEWHFVKNGDLPKENKKYLVLTSDGEPKVDSWLNITWLYSYDVIAWKEIILPKEIEK